MKKILIAMLVCFVLFSFSSCKCKHEWSEATCTEPMTCSLCGEKQGEPLGHKWTEATCTEPMTCSLCGEKQGNTIAHHYSNATVTINPSCTRDGETTSICEVCGKELKESVNATGHNYVEIDHLSSLQPTCEREGRKVEECVNCGDLKYTTLPATGHTLGDVRYRYGNKEVFVCTTCNRSVETKVPKEPGKFFKLGIVDGFGSPKSGYYVSAEGFKGTYNKENVVDGDLEWKVDISSDMRLIFTLLENNSDKDLSTSYFENSEYSVSFKSLDGKEYTYTGKLTKSSSYKLNCIVVDRVSLYGVVISDPAKSFIMAKKVQIIISNENGQYNLGTVDTSEIESMLYDQKLNDAVVSLVSEKKYQEALDLLDSATETVTRWGSTYKVWKDAESANFYGYDELIKDCTFRMYYEPAMELHELGQNIEAITQLRKLKEVNRDLYDANKCDELVKEWQALAIGPAGGFIFYDKGFYSDGWRYLEAAPSDLKGKYAFCSQQKYIYKAYVGEDGEIFKNRYYEYGVDYKDNYNYADEYELKLIEISKEEYEADIENLSWGGSGKTKYFAASKYPIDLKTSDSIGSGKENTEKILTVYGEDAPAAYAVSLYSVNGFDDWFLPSKEEGNLMLSAIGYNGIGGFRDEEGTRVTIENAKNRSYELVYVSSTQASWDLGSQDLIGSTHSWMEYEYRVRPIRAF